MGSQKWLHPAFWFQFDGAKFKEETPDMPWETRQLNVTREFLFDYTNIDPEFTLAPFSFELFNWRWWCHLAVSRWYLAPGASAIYLLTIFTIQMVMRNKKPLNLKWPLFLWNLSLGIFSLAGLSRTAPEFFYVLLGEQGGIYKAICYRNQGNWPTAFWSLAFVLSKYVELGDTVFIVLRKRKLLFLQWYHHVVTLLLCWLTAPFLEPISRWYMVMNYFVHSMMYPYFALMGIGVKVPRKIAMFITTCQLTQMIIGVLVNLSSIAIQQMGIPCYRHEFSVKMCLFVYGSFSILFARLFMDSFSNKKVREIEKKQE